MSGATDEKKSRDKGIFPFYSTVFGLVGMVVTTACAGQPEAVPPAMEGPSLKVFANSFIMGAAIPGAELNQAERQLLFKHFDAVTSENVMKAHVIQPREGQFNFGPADGLVELARANNLKVNGHTLLWHERCPEWFFVDGGKPASRELALERMRHHISTVVGRYAGRVHSWDVVNEGLRKGALRNSKWLQTIGEDYIAEAFIAARQADPNAELYYNDYRLETGAKRGAALRLIHDLQSRGVRIDGIGIQGHWQLDQIPFRDLEDTIIAFHGAGVKVMITELDIDVVGRSRGNPYAQGLPPEIQQRLADQYSQLFALFLKHQDKISRVTFWGLHDGRSWLNTYPRRRTNHALLWDRELQPKPAFSAVVRLAQ